MDVVGHEAVGQDLHPVLFTLGMEQVQVGGIIFLFLENGHGTNAALGDVVRDAGEYDSCCSCHGREYSRNWYCVPGFWGSQEGVRNRYYVPRF